MSNANTQKANQATQPNVLDTVQVAHNPGNPEQTPQVAPAVQEVEQTSANPQFIKLSEMLGLDTQELDALISHCLDNIGNFLQIGYKAMISNDPKIFLPQVIELIEESGVELPMVKIVELVGELKAKPEFQQLASGISHPLIGQINLPSLFTVPLTEQLTPRLESVNLESFNLRFDVHGHCVTIHNDYRPVVKITKAKFEEIKALNSAIVKAEMTWRSRQYQTGSWTKLFVDSEDIVSAGMGYVYAK